MPLARYKNTIDGHHGSEGDLLPSLNGKTCAGCRALLNCVIRGGGRGTALRLYETEEPGWPNR